MSLLIRETEIPARETESRVEAGDARAFVEAVLVHSGLRPRDASTVATCLVRANLRGVDTHGIARLPNYLDRLQRNLIEPRPLLTPQRVGPSVATLDGQNAFGFVVATRAIDEAIVLARDSGVGIVSARRSTHFGMAATYVLQAIESGFIALVMTNASPGLPPWGSKRALLGTSPIAIGAPVERGSPFVLDMSPTVVARGKIRRAVELDQPIPLGWALDASGKPTTDPEAALDGVLLPIGDHKGSGLAIAMDILGGVISGAAFGGEVGDQYRDFDRPQNVGHFFLVIRPDLSISLAEYYSRMASLMQRIRASERAKGFTEVLVPGELEFRMEQERLVAGIPVSSKLCKQLDDVADTTGVLKLRRSARSLG
jgi:LDH2 family malate/lactate/ureidoglycolate dehydrogenase